MAANLSPSKLIAVLLYFNHVAVALPRYDDRVQDGLVPRQMNDDGYLDHQAMHGTLYSNRLDLTDVTRLPFTATMEMGNTPKPNTVGATGAFTDPSEIGVALQKRATSLDVDDHDALRDEAGEVAEKSAEMERRLLQATTAKQARQKGWSIKDVLLAAAVVLGSKVKGIIDKMPHHHRA